MAVANDFDLPYIPTSAVVAFCSHQDPILEEAFVDLCGTRGFKPFTDIKRLLARGIQIRVVIRFLPVYQFVIRAALCGGLTN